MSAWKWRSSSSLLFVQSMVCAAAPRVSMPKAMTAAASRWRFMPKLLYSCRAFPHEQLIGHLGRASSGGTMRRYPIVLLATIALLAGARAYAHHSVAATRSEESRVGEGGR